MKFISLLAAMVLVSGVAQAAGNWKVIANETLWPNAPFFRDIRVPDNAEYSQVRIYVAQGTLRIQNATVLTTKYGQLPLWSLQGDYRSPRMADAMFQPGPVRSLRFDMRALDMRAPARVQISIR